MPALPLLLLLALLLLAAAAPHGSVSLRDTVRRHLANGGQDAIRAALQLRPGVHYDPFRFLTREDRPPPRGQPAASGYASDLALLRALGHHVPGVDRPPFAARALDDCDGGEQRDVYGSRSRITVTYSPSTLPGVHRPVEYAVRLWADAFESKDPIRLCFVWSDSLEELTLGATNSPFVVMGDNFSALKDGVAYSPALASAMQGEDVVENQFHVKMILNEKIKWHFDTGSEAPFGKYDLATTVLHELSHGLFFSGTIQADPNNRKAQFAEGQPGRFDVFMSVVGRVPVAQKCGGDDKNLFNAITNPSLRMKDDATGANFGLYSPPLFVPGSSTYHFDNETLSADCAGNNIPKSDCSDLMTHQLDDGYTQHSIGETTLRVLRAMKSSGDGVRGGEQCDLPESPIPDTSNSQGVGGGALDFKLPTWGIATVAVVAGVGFILVFCVVISSVVARRSDRKGGS